MLYSKRFKKRSMLTSKNKLLLKELVFFKNQQLLPLKLFKFFKRVFRKFFLKKKIQIIFNVRFNYSVSFKGKNPRMGKGTGFFIRKSLLVTRNQIFFKGVNISYTRMLKLKNLFHKNYSLKV